jgi:SAM-dependent methyltransferase
MIDNWYKKWFNTADYLELYDHRNSTDAKKIVSLINRTIKLPKGSKLLDLACGNGRHSVFFAEKGYDVLGIDLSPYLISEAKKKLRSEYLRFKKNLKFDIGDMRNLSRKNEFDLVVNLFSSFGYFEEESQNRSVINSISRSLKKDGYFFFDFLNSEYLRRNLAVFDAQKRNRNIIIQVREITGKFVKKDILIIRNKPGSKYPELRRFHEKVRLYTLAELRQIFRSNRLKIVKLFGDYSGKPFRKNSSGRLIILAQKI